MDNNKVRVRFAPSPTGHLHVGGARTALFNFLFARKMQGTFVLRAEDTDTARSSEISLHNILSDLNWLGLTPDEGVTLEGEKGDYGPYRQSQRMAIYQNLAQELISKGLAYYCFLDEKNMDEDAMMMDNSPYRDAPLDSALSKIATGEKPTIRFKTPSVAKEYVLFDLVRGRVAFPSSTVKDFVILRNTGMPTYNFACAVDDYLMKISHVIRAEEHLNNTVKQLMIFEAVNAPPPKYAHISLILGEDRQKLSKRHGATSINQFKDQGYLPSALVNYLALLGWSSPNKEQEIIGLKELEKLFSLKRVNPAPAVFDVVKLNWMNSFYLRNISASDLKVLVFPYTKGFKFTVDTTDGWWKEALDLLKPSVSTIKALGDALKNLSVYDPEISAEGQEVLSWPLSIPVLKAWDTLLSQTKTLSAESFMQQLTDLKASTSAEGKALYWPLRVGLIGDAHGPDMKTFVPLISVEEIRRRIKKLID